MVNFPILTNLMKPELFCLGMAVTMPSMFPNRWKLIQSIKDFVLPTSIIDDASVKAIMLDDQCLALKSSTFVINLNNRKVSNKKLSLKMEFIEIPDSIKPSTENEKVLEAIRSDTGDRVGLLIYNKRSRKVYVKTFFVDSKRNYRSGSVVGLALYGEKPASIALIGDYLLWWNGGKDIYFEHDSKVSIPTKNQVERVLFMKSPKETPALIAIERGKSTLDADHYEKGTGFYKYIIAYYELELGWERKMAKLKEEPNTQEPIKKGLQSRL